MKFSKNTLIDLFFCIIFAVFAYLQLNDPDPVLWTIGYLLVSILAILNMIGKLNQGIVYVVSSIYLVALAIFLPEFINWIQLGMPDITGKMKAESPYIEYAREFFGLLICLAACFFYFKKIKRDSQ